jgi:copper chaperone NosL
MSISQAGFAGQIVAPSEEPRFFDDIGCLARYVKESQTLPEGAVAFVADHRTREWVRADAAHYTLVASLATPMGSHLVAHRDAASRDADPEARAGAPRSSVEVFGPAGPPGGAR